jgi:hypothetical protein
MELLSQLDVANPDHVSVITKQGRVVISVRKDGADVTVGFPIDGKVFNTTPRPPLQQPVPVIKSITRTGGNSKPALPTSDRLERAARFNAKLTKSTASQIKEMLKDKSIMSQFRSRNQAYIQIGQAYGVSQHTIRGIDKGFAWKSI